MTTLDPSVENLLREQAPQVLGALVRRYGHFDTGEEAVQEALLAAATQWPTEGVPDSPKAWLIRVASRKLTDLLRSDQARRRREDTVAARALPEEFSAPGADSARPADADDTQILLFMCCHPELTAASQIALTLRAVGGLTTEEIARAFLVPESTMGQRISRAKQRIKTSGVGFRMPPEQQRSERLGAVLHTLYLIFNEGYTSTSGPDPYRAELSSEAILLARMVYRLLPDDGEVAGLLALMLLTDARRPARAGATGELIPLADQERSLWNREFITEGIALITDSMSRPPVGPYQLQATIAAVHDEAERSADTDWPQIAALYRLLLGISDNPMVRLNYAVALAMARGPRAGLEVIESLESDQRIAKHHRLDAVRAHLLEMAGESQAARSYYRSAARRTTSLPERRYLEGKADALK